MPFLGGTGINGPLKHAAHTQFPFGVNSVGGNIAQKAKIAYLNGCQLEAVDNMPVLPYGIPDDGPRLFGWDWNGCNYPGPYVTTTSPTQGLAFNVVGVPTITDTIKLGGAITITPAATALSKGQLFSDGTPFVVIPGKRMWFTIRVQAPTVSQGSWIFGLIDAVQADLTTLPPNGIFFLKLDTVSTSTFHVRKAGTSTTVATVETAAGQTLTNSVDIEYGFLVDYSGASGLLSTATAGVSTSGGGAISCYVNGVFAGQVASTDPNVPGALTFLGYTFGRETTAGGAAGSTLIISQSLMMSEL